MQKKSDIFKSYFKSELSQWSTGTVLSFPIKFSTGMMENIDADANGIASL